MTHHASIAGRAAKAFERAEAMPLDTAAELSASAMTYRHIAMQMRLAYELATEQVAGEE